MSDMWLGDLTSVAAEHSEDQLQLLIGHKELNWGSRTPTEGTGWQAQYADT